MVGDNEIINDIEQLLSEYSVDIEKARKKGLLNEKTACTSLLRLTKFIRWCKEDFVLGRKNKQ